MSPLDPANSDVLADFVAEARELIEATDQSLVALEQRPDDGELINAVFRAMHTIKGSSSFLALQPITELAHAAEDALNDLRQSAAGSGGVTADTMDLILRAVDLLRQQIEQGADGAEIAAAPADLLGALRRLGAGGKQRNQARAVKNTSVAEAPAEALTLDLPEAKRDILAFMVEDMLDILAQLAGLVDGAAGAEAARAAVTVADLTEQLRRCAAFFAVPALTRESTALHEAATELATLEPAALAQVLPPMAKLVQVLHDRAQALGESRLLAIDTDELLTDLHHAVQGTAAAATNAHDPTAVAPPTVSAPAVPPAARNAPGEREAAHTAEQTIRVDVNRLEALLNLVGELVLQKNRVLGIGRRLLAGQNDHKIAEELTQVGGDLDQITSDLQLGVMKTRMQPLSKLFNRYPRVIRDIARNLHKQIELRLVGGDTEVDKSMIEALGDPLVHLLRNSADHGIETPDERAAAGKGAAGVIELRAGHEGNHVLVSIRDDGRGLNQERIVAKAIERGLVTADAGASMSAADINNLIFLPGFSTAEQVSDVSGRGVGMDVVRTNIARLNGTVSVQSQRGSGTEVRHRAEII